MSYEENLRSLTLNADATLGIYTGVPGQPGSAVPNSGKQYCFVKVTGVNQVGLAVGGSEIVIGVLQNKPQKPGAAATVGYEGVTNVMSGSALAAGIRVGPNGTGRAVAAAGGPLVTLGTAAGAGELVPALFAGGVGPAGPAGP